MMQLKTTKQGKGKISATSRTHETKGQKPRSTPQKETSHCLDTHAREATQGKASNDLRINRVEDRLQSRAKVWGIGGGNERPKEGTRSF